MTGDEFNDIQSQIARQMGVSVDDVVTLHRIVTSDEGRSYTATVQYSSWPYRILRLHDGSRVAVRPGISVYPAVLHLPDRVIIHELRSLIEQLLALVTESDLAIRHLVNAFYVVAHQLHAATGTGVELDPATSDLMKTVSAKLDRAQRQYHEVDRRAACRS